VSFHALTRYWITNGRGIKANTALPQWADEMVILKRYTKICYCVELRSELLRHSAVMQSKVSRSEYALKPLAPCPAEQTQN
jgi:hypothetical protein